FKGFKYGWIDIIEKGFSFGLLDTFNPIFLKPKLWVDPSDTSTLFQDAAGTVPVASAGDPVGLVLDKSGNGNHLTAPSDAARPVYQTDGTYHWLQFDGVDDQLEAATRFGLVANPALLVVSGVRPISYYAANNRIWHIGATNTFKTISGALGTDGLSWRHNNGFRKFEVIPVGSDYVLTHSRQAGDTYGDQLGFVNGAASAETSSGNPNFTPSSTEAQFYLGSRGGEHLNMRLYSLTIMGEHTAAQQSQLERWTSRKAGVTL
ncbi:MAG: hypothetical protein GY766_01655, partial [Herbaspirillum sp.]|uniref:hypothetical protein n=1 Tax=Herbaspirillum sp. TaxID=1890675 RepID=UPI002586A313